MRFLDRRGRSGENCGKQKERHAAAKLALKQIRARARVDDSRRHYRHDERGARTDEEIIARLFHADVFPQEGRDIQVLTFHNRRLAFFKTTARDRLELQDPLLGLDGCFRGWLRFLDWQRLFLWHDQSRRGCSFFRYAHWRFDVSRRRLLKRNEM